MKIRNMIVILFLIMGIGSGCSGAVVNAKVPKKIDYFSKTFKASPNECYYALRWALKINGYPVAKEDLPAGIIKTVWRPVTSDSHYLPVFDSKDYGATGAYHQLEVRVVPRDSKTKVEVGSRLKTIAPHMKSSGVEERKILAQVGNYLRDHEPMISNEGISE
jgi:hypothetical protein